MPVHKEAEALRDGEQAAREREQARQEMENTLIQQEVDAEDTRIDEQSITGRRRDDGTDRVFLGGVGPNSGAADEVGEPLGENPMEQHEPHREYRDNERTFEGDGRRPLDEQ